MALYYGSQRLSPFTLRRVVYVGGRNTSPIARTEVSALVVGVGEKVWFDGRNSSDADGDPLSFSWNFGDGSTGVGRVKSHNYDRVGIFHATLSVHDGNGGQHTSTTIITVGSPPKVVMLYPTKGTEFAVGQQLILDGVGTDRNGRRLPPSSLQWEVRKHHATHWHPFLSPTKGNEVLLLPAPSPEDFLAATNSHLEILLTATDADGLSATESRIIKPKTVFIDFDTNPPGVELSVDGFRIRTPHRVVSWANHSMQIAAHNDAERTFVLWSDGGPKEHAIVARDHGGTGPMKYVATFHSKSYWEKILDFLSFATSRNSEADTQTIPAS